MRPHIEKCGGRWEEAAQLEHHRSRFDVATLRKINLLGKNIGFIGVRDIGVSITIELFCIEPMSQGRGIGSAALAIVLANADVESREVILDVLRGNPAARLYERHGFLPTCENNSLVSYRREPRAVDVLVDHH